MSQCCDFALARTTLSTNCHEGIWTATLQRLIKGDWLWFTMSKEEEIQREGLEGRRKAQLA